MLGIPFYEITLIIHDNNVGPEQVMTQLNELKIPMKVLIRRDDIESTKALITEMGAYFHREQAADSINKNWIPTWRRQLQRGAELKDKPKVVVIHYGRANNVYLTLTKNTTGGKMIDWAGGQIPVEGERGMMQLSAEVIAKADPDVILLTDFGYDKLGSLDQIKTLPG